MHALHSTFYIYILHSAFHILHPTFYIYILHPTSYPCSTYTYSNTHKQNYLNIRLHIHMYIWVVVWNVTLIFFHILGMSSSPLTFIFFRVVQTTNQIMYSFGKHIGSEHLRFILNNSFVNSIQSTKHSRYYLWIQSI